MNTPEIQQNDEIADLVQKAWYKYDVDRNGYLDKRETLKFLNDILYN